MVSWFAKNNFRRRQNLGVAFGLLAGVLLVVWLCIPGNARLHAPGVMNIGHEKLQCEECHLPGNGSLRQKIQANMRYLLGERNSAVPLGFLPVTNEDCLECHERPNERHPVIGRGCSATLRSPCPHPCFDSTVRTTHSASVSAWAHC